YSTTLFDGYGRIARKASKNDEQTPYNQEDFCYDSMGRLAFKSYPYQANGFSTAKVCSGLGDSFAYDALGRTTKITHSDASFRSAVYTGTATQITFEGNGSSSAGRILQKDGLGRLSSVCELYNGAALAGSGGTPGSCGLDITGTGFLTTYGYNALGKLTTVSQGALTNRSYGYDSLARLTSETTPEAGVANYTYNADGLVQTRVRSAPNQTDQTKTFTTTYAYDELHRPRGRTYTS